MFGLRIGKMGALPRAGAAQFSPASFFANGEQGWWFDPSNFATLFQDSAGTTPVTAVEQPVGLQLDSRDLSYSVFFNGTSDVISTAASSAFNFGTGDFALSAWINPTNTTGVKIIIDCRASSVGNPGPVVYLNGAALASAKNNTDVINSGGTVLANVWSFVELTRTSGNWRIFLNGALVAGPTLDTVDYTNNSSVFIGRNATVSFQFYDGYISNARVVKGTGGVTSTVPTSALTAVPGTGILTCGVSWSGNPAITSAGTANKLNPYTTGTGNHRFQSAPANRPKLAALVNLLTKTEQFDDAVWTKNDVTVPPTKYIAPNGTLTADSLLETATTASHFFNQTVSAGGVARIYRATVRVKPINKQYIALTMNNAISNGIGIVFDLTNISVVGTIFLGTGWSVLNSNITPDAEGFFILSAEISAPAATNHVFEIVARSSSSTSWIDSYLGNTSNGYYVWGADLRPTNQGVGLPAYQRVNTSTDYDSTGFPVYIKPNGSNQFMQTNSINFTATDKMTVWQGVRKLTDASTGVAMESSPNFNTNPGTFAIFTALSSGSNYSFLSYANATPIFVTSPNTFVAPITNVLACIGDISGDVATLRINGVQVATSSADQGTGNYGNYSAFFYARGGTSVFFNGNDYGSIARGAASTAAQITAGETYINSKTKAF